VLTPKLKLRLKLKRTVCFQSQSLLYFIQARNNLEETFADDSLRSRPHTRTQFMTADHCLAQPLSLSVSQPCIYVDYPLPRKLFDSCPTSLVFGKEHLSHSFVSASGCQERLIVLQSFSDDGKPAVTGDNSEKYKHADGSYSDQDISDTLSFKKAYGSKCVTTERHSDLIFTRIHGKPTGKEYCFSSEPDICRYVHALKKHGNVNSIATLQDSRQSLPCSSRQCLSSCEPNSSKSPSRSRRYNVGLASKYKTKPIKLRVFQTDLRKN